MQNGGGAEVRSGGAEEPRTVGAGAWIQLLLALAIGIFCSWQTYGIYRGLEHRADYLYWDPAAHAWYGARLTIALRNFDPIGFLSTLNEQTLWPPLHSILQIPFQLAFGPGFRAASLCSFAALVLLFPALTFLYLQCGAPDTKHRTDWGGWLVFMAFAASSPYYAGYGSMPMLEIFGAALTAVSLGFYLRQSRWFPLSLAMLFFLKYNYCIYVAMPILFLVGMRWIHSVQIRHIVKGVTAFQWFVLTYLAFLALIFVTGGFQIGRVSVRGIGNPLYILFLIIVMRAAVRGQWKGAWRRIRGTGWEWFAVPVFVWLLIPVPNRIRTITSFAINAPLSGHSPSQLSYYTFYFDALGAYFSTRWLEGICLAGAAACLVLLRRNKKVLVVALLFALPFVLMTLNQNKQERYLLTFVFASWLLCALAVSRIPVRAIRLLAAAALCVACAYYYDIRSVHDLVAWPFTPATVDAPVAYLARQSGGEPEAHILGVTNEMSPALLALHISRASGFSRVPRLERDLDRKTPAGVLVCGINQDVPGRPIRARQFPGYRITCARWEGP